MTNHTEELNKLLIDDDFNDDVRRILIEGYDGMEEYESGRGLDLSNAWFNICNMSTDERSMLYMEYSLCPIHHIDWAICFDDEPDDCAQVRAIFPHSHDT
jgi:hypothetical protein